MAKWSLGINQVAKFPNAVAREMERRFGFLRIVEPKDLLKVQEEMKAKLYKCDIVGCDYETNSEKKLRGHKLGAHKVSRELEEVFDKLPAAQGEKVQSLAKPGVSPEGIPDDEVDGWVGKGLEDDVATDNPMKVIRQGMPGVF